MVGPRPFYVIGHNTNTIEQVKDCLHGGANALEPDVNVYADDSSRLCISHGRGGSTAPDLPSFLGDLHETAAANPALALIVFDCKPPTATPEHGLALLTAIRLHLTHDRPDLTIVLSIANREDDKDRVFALIHDGLGPREGLMVDAEDDPDAVVQFFRSRHVTNFGYGNGISVLNAWLGRRYRFAVERACAVRAQTGDPKFVYVWTVNDSDDQHEYIRIGVDGVITDDIPMLLRVVQANPTRIRMATTADSPFVTPRSEYGLSIRTGDLPLAGTDATVNFTIRGRDGTTSETLNASLIKRLEADNWTSMTVPSQDLGPLTSLTVASDGLGASPDWYPEHVLLGSHAYQAAGISEFRQWIAGNEPVTKPITPTDGVSIMSDCAFPVIPPLADRWLANGGPDGPFGCPIGPQEPMPGSRGARQRFEGGEIGWLPEQEMVSSVFDVEGDAYFDWELAPSSPLHYDYFRIELSLNGTGLGWSSAKYQFNDQPDGQQRRGGQRFHLNRPGDYTFVVKGCDDPNVAHQGWTAPVRLTVPGSCPATPGQPEVSGLAAQRWAALGGTSGPMGAPTGAARPASDQPDALTQDFERGGIRTYPRMSDHASATWYQRGGALVTDWEQPPFSIGEWTFVAAPAADPAHPVAVSGIEPQLVWGAVATTSRRHVFWLAPGDYELRAETQTSILTTRATIRPITPDATLPEIPPKGAPAYAAAVRPSRAAALARHYVETRPVLWATDTDLPTGEDQTFQLIALLHSAAADRHHRAPGQLPSIVQSALLLRSMRRGEVGTGRDYDMTLKGIVTCLYRYRSLLTDRQVDLVISNLVPPDLHAYTEFPPSVDFLGIDLTPLIGAVVSLPETENHILMTWSSLYLINQLRYARTGDARYDNTANGLTARLLEYLHTIAKHDFMEFNSRSYARLSTHSLLNLYEFANDPLVLVAAQNLLDYANVKFALSSSRGRSSCLCK